MKRTIVLPLVLLLTLLSSAKPSSHGALSSGFEWTVESTEFSGTFTSIALDDGGYPHISYLDSNGVRYAYKDAGGWYSQAIDSSQGSAYAYTSIALDGDGYGHICYAGSNGNLKHAYQDAGGWYTEDVTTEVGNEGDFCAIALDDSGYPHISYHDNLVTDPDGHLKYAYKDGTGWHIEPVDTDGEFTDIALDSGGYPHISYRSWEIGTGYKLGYAYKDGTGWHTTIVDPLVVSGFYTSIALDASDYPAISYLDSANDDLKYAYKDGTGWHRETIDSVGQVGEHTSLALDGSGYPHISYYDVTNEDLKYAYQDGTGWQIATVDSDGNVGLYTSIALDGSYPHISYYDASNDLLKYAYAGPLPGHWVLAVTKAGTGGGIVTSAPAGIDCGGACSAGFADGTTVSLVATAEAGSRFSGWSGDPDCSDGQVTMDADKACTATFLSFRVYLPVAWHMLP